jgi:DNA-binding NarL/FixJ family response regulator
MPTRPRVLLADDHPGIVTTLRRLLSPECDVVGVVSDGAEVAATAARLQPVVSVVDLNMPNASGLDVCRQIKRNDPGAKVILITALFDETIRNEALAAGASGFFLKFAPVDDLIVAVKRVWTESTIGEDQ